MGISLIADVISVATTQGLGFAKFLLLHHHSSASCNLSAISDTGSYSFHSGEVLTISAAALPTDAISPPTVRSSHCRSAPRTLTRRTRRTRRRSLTGEAEEGGDDGFFGGGDGPFGGGGGGGDGGRWNFDRSEGSNWGEPSYSDPAFDFVYQVLCWIVLSHCMHFAFKRVVRILADLPRE